MSESVITILIITDTRLTGLGGSEKHIRFLEKNMPKSKYKIVIAELQGQDEEKIKSDILSVQYRANTTLFKFNVKRIYGIGAIKACYRLARIIDNENVDIVLSFHEKSDIINSFLKKIKSKIICVSSRRDLNICPSRILLVIRTLLQGKMDFIIAPSRSIISFLVKNEEFPESRTLVIPNSVSTELSNSTTKVEPHILGLLKGKICGICVANLKEVKGHKYLVDAFHIVCKKFPDAILFLVGADSGVGSKIQEQINKLSLGKNIYLLGRRTDVAELLQFCHYMVSASLSEGLSNALIEGLASGLPLVATDVGGNGEIVVDGINGFLCDARNPEMLAYHISRLIGDHELRSAFGDASRKLAEKKFNQRMIIEQYDKFFDELISIHARKN